MRGKPKLSGSIDPYTASPSEFMQWWQQQAAQDPYAFGSWRSEAASESLRDRAAFEGLIKEQSDFLRGSLANTEVNELDDWEQSLSTFAKKLLDTPFPANVGNVAYYSALTDLVEDVKRAVARLGHELPEEVAFGLLPTGLVNGRARAVPAGGLAIAIDDGLFNFVYSLAKAIATFCKVTVIDTATIPELEVSWIDNDIARAVRTNEDANCRWLEILFATFVIGYPNEVPQRLLLGDRILFYVPLVTAVEFFVVAHEFGHLILGHYERNHTASRRKMPGGVEVDEFETQREEELEADRLGLELLREHHRSLGLSLDNTRWPIWFWAGCLNIIELMSGGPARTHPSAGVRSERLL